MIKLRKLTYKNFKSAGSVPIVVQLDATNTTFVSGKNGAGKSSILAALCFVLFGRAYGSVNKPLLANSINQKQCLVTIEFSIGNKNFVISRGIKPAILDIMEDGVLRAKSADVRDDQKIIEQQILKMNYRSFTQTVIMGAEYYVPFMRLESAPRRGFIEDLLDVRVISAMNKLLSDRQKILKESLRNIETAITSTKDKIRMQMEFVDKLEKRVSDAKSDKTEERNRLSGELVSLNQELQSSLVVFDSINKSLTEQPEMVEELSEQRLILRAVNQEITTLTSKIEQYSNLHVCPTCNQTVDEFSKKAIIDEDTRKLELHRKTKDDAELNHKELSVRNAKREKTYEEWSEAKSIVASIQNKIIITTTLLEKIDNQPVIADDDSIAIEKTKLKEFAKKIVSLDAEKKQAVATQHQYDLAASLLHDTGIKAKIIKQYIPTLNKLVNKYLDELDFFVSFYLDENFNEKVKSRHRDDFTYEAFSAGQKLRIDLALTFAFREIAKMKNSVNINLLILDEIDGPLDEEGAILMYSLLKKISAENVFIISHKHNMGDRFNRHLEFTLNQNFTTMKEI